MQDQDEHKFDSVPGSQEGDLISFTIMPSGLHNEYQGGPDESRFVFRHIIKAGISLAARRLKRSIRADIEVDRNRPGSITKSIIRSLAAADYVIADLTGGNPNVFLELGIRYSLCPVNTILLHQGNMPLPFDIANFKAISYDRFKPEEAAGSLADYLVNTQTNAIDSPVFEYIENLVVSGNGLNQFTKSPSYTPPSIMSWAEIMQRIEGLRFYSEHFTSGTFTPDAIVGISNGGMIMAEIISRKYFHRVPLVCLWADRWSPERINNPLQHYFSNPYARAAIAPLKQLAGDGKSVTLLIVDDNVASGTTCEHVVRFLREELGAATRIIFQPVVCKATALQYLATVEGVLAPAFRNGLFRIGKQEFLNQLSTNKNSFPYDKDIRG